MKNEADAIVKNRRKTYTEVDGKVFINVFMCDLILF